MGENLGTPGIYNKKRKADLPTLEFRNLVFEHMKQNAEKKGIWLDSVNGYNNHVHCLISLGREQTISKVAQLIKGESAFWINQNRFLKGKFVWQDDYWAVSVSESHLGFVRKYIRSQEEHHRRKSFAKELYKFIEKCD